MGETVIRIWGSYTNCSLLFEHTIGSKLPWMLTKYLFSDWSMRKNAQIDYKERNGIFVLYSVPRNLSRLEICSFLRYYEKGMPCLSLTTNVND